MKKNIAMRVAAFLFILTMITTCAFATTFAKYTTKGEAEDSARVAKWGVVITGKTDAANELFVTEYGSTVKASVDVVAPGTTGMFSDFVITGEPEVSAEVTFDIAIAGLEKWRVPTDKFYCPIIITIGNGSTSQEIDGKNYTSAATFINAIETAVRAIKFSYAVGETISADNFNISWEWPFSTSADNDIYDTYYGDLAKNESDAPKITVTVYCTVTQID